MRKRLFQKNNLDLFAKKEEFGMAEVRGRSVQRNQAAMHNFKVESVAFVFPLPR